MPTLKQLQYLIKIVEENGFIAASEKLYIAQSALSRQMKLLEQDVGFDIFDRRGKNMQLTPAGQQFYQNIKIHLSGMQDIIQSSQHIAQGIHRVIKIAHSSSVIMDQTKIQALDYISKKYQIQIELNTLSSEQQIQALLHHQIDIGMIRSPVLHHMQQIHSECLYHQPLYLAINTVHAKFDTLQKIKIEDLKDELFVSTPHAERGGLSYLVSNLCLSRGFFPKKASIQSRKISQLQLVAANLGICIVPLEFQSILPPQVKLLSLEQNTLMSEVKCIWKQDSDLDPYVEELVQMLQTKSI